jgi:hypothetical protein
MTRPLRIEYPGAVYHVTSRGNEKKKRRPSRDMRTGRARLPGTCVCTSLLRALCSALEVDTITKDLTLLLYYFYLG